LFFNHYKILNKGFSEKYVNLTTKGFLSQEKSLTENPLPAALNKPRDLKTLGFSPYGL